MINAKEHIEANQKALMELDVTKGGGKGEVLEIVNRVTTDGSTVRNKSLALFHMT